MNSNVLKACEAIRRKWLIRKDADDVDWITINHTPVPIDNKGDLMGHVGKKISGTQETKQSKNKFSGAKTVDEITDKMLDDFPGNGVPIYARKRKVNIGAVQKYATGIHDFLTDYPETQGVWEVKVIGDDSDMTFASSGYAYNKNQILVPEGVLSGDHFEDGKSWGHPKGYSESQVAYHEMAHGLEAWITRTMDPDNADTSFSEANVARAICKRALRKVAEQYPNIDKAAGSIGNYAAQWTPGKDEPNFHEVLAEALADCYSNGDDASPYSKEVKNELDKAYKSAEKRAKNNRF